MAEFKNLIVKNVDDILIVTINREKALNALNKETVMELQQLFSSYWSDVSVKGVIITGAGEKSFVAGADIPELAELNVQDGAKTMERGQYLMKTIQNFPKPVIAAINGFALGGGCELAMSCDIRLASEKAKFGQPEVNLGIIPGYGGTQRLSRLVGRGKATQLIMTGQIIKADEAYRIGLVDEIYSPDELMDKALEMAKTIASKAPLAVSAAKECINRGLDISLTAGCDLEKTNFAMLCESTDKKEGMGAFMEKRTAKFTGN